MAKLRAACPACGSLAVFRAQRTKQYRCHHCHHHGWTDPVWREARQHRGPKTKPKPKRSAGSGVIAGRIEIPGYRWGSTRLG